MKKLFVILFLFLVFSSAVWADNADLSTAVPGVRNTGSWFVQPTER